MAVRFRANAQHWTPGLDAHERFPRRWIRGGQSAGIAIRIGSALRSAQATRPRARHGYAESSASIPIYPDQAIQSRLLWDSASIHTRAEELETLLILNWPGSCALTPAIAEALGDPFG